jgi:hypothetical protein
MRSSGLHMVEEGEGRAQNRRPESTQSPTGYSKTEANIAI